MPIGLMVHANGFDEATAPRVAHGYEQATHWHTKTSDLGWAEG